MLYDFYKETEHGEEYYFGGTVREVSRKIAEDIRNGNPRPSLIAKAWCTYKHREEDDG